MQRERKEQEYVVTWCRLKYPKVLIVASANGGKRNIREAANMKREGVLSGMPDLNVLAARRGYHGLFVELKAPATLTKRKGSITKLQVDMIKRLNEEGYHAVVAWGFEDAKKVIDWYLEA